MYFSKGDCFKKYGWMWLSANSWKRTKKNWKLEIFTFPIDLCSFFHNLSGSGRKSGLRKTVFSVRRPLFRFAVFKADRTKKNIYSKFVYIHKKDSPLNWSAKNFILPVCFGNTTIKLKEREMRNFKKDKFSYLCYL